MSVFAEVAGIVTRARGSFKRRAADVFTAQTSIEYPQSLLLAQEYLERHGTNITYPAGSPREGHMHKFVALRSLEGAIMITKYTNHSSTPENTTSDRKPHGEIVFATWIKRSGEAGVIKLFPDSVSITGSTTTVSNPQAVIGDWNHGKGPDFFPPGGEVKIDVKAFTSMLLEAHYDGTLQQASEDYVKRMHIEPYLASSDNGQLPSPSRRIASAS